MGNNVILAATSTAKNSGSGSLFLIAIVVLFGVLYFVMIRPQRNRQRAAMQTQRNVEPGTRVRTTAGMYATVVAVEDGDVLLEVAPGVEVRFLRRAIMDVVPDVDDTMTPGDDNVVPGTGQMDVHDTPPADSEHLDEAEDDAAAGG